MTIQRPGNLGNLKAAAAARTAATATRTDAGLREMLRTGQPITFRGLARHAGGDPAGVASPETTSSVVATLTAQLTDLRRRHREETTRLRRELEAAHGENLLLRRRLAAGHDPGQRETS
jgi:hypothetical protein